MANLSQDDLLDALFDLQHDLGKYLCLPLAWLTAEAPPEEVRRVALKALLETRSGPNGSCSANDLWQAFLEEVGGGLKDAHKWPALTTAVEQALAWSEALQTNSAPPNRPAITADFTRIAHAIRDLIKELNDAS